MRNYHSRQRNSKSTTILYILAWVLTLCVIGLSGYVAYNFFRYNILNFKGINYIVYAGLIVVSLLLLILQFRKKATKFVIVLGLILAGVLGYGSFTLAKSVNTFSNLKSSNTQSVITMAVYVPVDSSVTSVQQLTKVDAPADMDGENIQSLLMDITTKQNVTLTVNNVSSYPQAYQNLVGGKAEALILNSAYEGLLENIDSSYATKIKKIYEYTITKTAQSGTNVASNSQSTSEKAPTSNDNSVFNLYISGIDTYGSIGNTSRSDVNIIMTVNTKTKQILLTTTPRDSYVRIADGGQNQYDKLTHAGIYGVNASVHTLENLYNIKLDYYVRINFTTFLQLIDLVGGVDVYNETAFTARNGTHFAAGTINLTSTTGLTFVRERYNLPNGDADRAANQQKVITAIIQKMTKPSNLVNVGNILNQLSVSMQTNMPFETVMLLANKQLESDKGYTVTSQALQTTGSMGLPSYAMPGYNLYMGVVNETSLATVRSAMQATMNAE